MNTKLHFSSAKDGWETPDELFAELDAEFGCTLDVCANRKNTKCKRWFGVRVNGLVQDWVGEVCWMNPPYGDPEHPCKTKCTKKICKKRGYHNAKYRPGIIDWVRTASVYGNGGSATVVCLLPARPDTKWWHRYIWDKELHCPRQGVEVRFLEGRLRFKGAKHSAPFPSCIVIFKGDI